MKPLRPSTSKPRAFVRSGGSDVDVIVQDARRAVKAVAGNLEHGACLYLAMASIIAAGRRGITLVPQAGTASFWRMGPDFVDDGKALTHFSYMWSGGVPHMEFVDITAMPFEIHVWAGDAKRGEIVDLSVADIPRACLEIGGLPWEAGPPPNYLWGRELPEGWHYEPNEQATLTAVDLAMRGAASSMLHELRRAMPPLSGPDSSHARLKTRQGLL